MPENTEPTDDVEALTEKYQALCHAMQSGVAFQHQTDMSDASPKHLRTGINVALCDQGALVSLLIQKGVFSLEEYTRELVLSMEAEVKRYEEELSQKHGATIKLA